MLVDRARRMSGPVGAMLPTRFTTTVPVDEHRAAVRRFERAGYPATWTNEVSGGKDALVQLAILLATTERMVFGTCIANIRVRPPEVMRAAAGQLAEAYPGRFVLGIGVGYPRQAAAAGREFGRPLAAARDYRRRMDQPTTPPAPQAEYPWILGANGPKMLDLAAELADGAIPALQPPEFTAQARKTLGPDKLLAVGVRVDRATARQQIEAHHAAGADHVILMAQPDGVFARAWIC